MSPDISMCSNVVCEKKLKCYRYIAKPSDYQTYGQFDSSDGCEDFWEIEPIIKFTGEDEVTICNRCRAIIVEDNTEELFCPECLKLLNNKEKK